MRVCSDCDGGAEGCVAETNEAVVVMNGSRRSGVGGSKNSNWVTLGPVELAGDLQPRSGGLFPWRNVSIGSRTLFTSYDALHATFVFEEMFK